MKILVTGGAGFIGSNLADALIKEKHQVVVVDNLSTGTRKNISPKVKFYKADITNPRKLEEIFIKEKPEAVFHLAAQIDVRKSMADPIGDAKINIIGGINLIRLAHKYKVKRFISSSTAGIYGDTKERPTVESHPECPPSPYGIAKLSIDKYLAYYNEVHGLPCISLRYGNVYGPRQNPHGEAGVVAVFLNKMSRGERPIINGNGRQVRDYVFVKDIVAANLAALKSKKTGIFNVGTAKETSVNQLFDEINRHFGKSFKKQHGPGKAGEQKTSCLSFAKINKELGWSPKTDFSEGIKKTFEWFKENGTR